MRASYTFLAPYIFLRGSLPRHLRARRVAGAESEGDHHHSFPHHPCIFVFSPIRRLPEQYLIGPVVSVLFHQLCRRQDVARCNLDARARRTERRQRS